MSLELLLVLVLLSMPDNMTLALRIRLLAWLLHDFKVIDFPQENK